MLARCSFLEDRLRQAINKIRLPRHQEKCGWWFLISFESQGQPKSWNMAGFHRGLLNEWISLEKSHDWKKPHQSRLIYLGWKNVGGKIKNKTSCKSF